MATTRTIQCADCGHPYETTRKNTLYCDVCRLSRDVMYMGTRTTKCLGCSERFCRLHRHDVLCAECDIVKSSLWGEGSCALCGQDQATRVRPDVAVCIGCAKAPEHRRVFIKALVKKVRTRKEAS